MNEQLYELKIYYALTIDPIHVGSGGLRLGRVDLPIIRDPATNIPKIPGSSLSGPARSYTAMHPTINRYIWEDNDTKYACAGRGGEGGEKHCGKLDPACPVCIPYGFSKGTSFSIQGLAQFFDAHILFFPVASIVGPIWVTAPMALEGLGLEEKFNVENNKYYPLGEQLKDQDQLNFGWLMLEKGKGSGNIDDCQITDNIKKRLVLVSNKLFSKIVNINLEVRTSISIDPATGTAEEGSLFTYEAIPRGTVLKFNIIYNSGKYISIGNKKLKTEDNNEISPQWVKTQVEKGLKLFEILGIGGMVTRGMGRLKILNLEEEDN
ncbi:MAG: type III-B CRISPR module RAMP protein Cmr4 [Promethearchaeota archaeon]